MNEKNQKKCGRYLTFDDVAKWEFFSDNKHDSEKSNIENAHHILPIYSDVTT